MLFQTGELLIFFCALIVCGILVPLIIYLTKNLDNRNKIDYFSSDRVSTVIYLLNSIISAYTDEFFIPRVRQLSNIGNSNMHRDIVMRNSAFRELLKESVDDIIKNHIPVDLYNELLRYYSYQSLVLTITNSLLTKI